MNTGFLRREQCVALELKSLYLSYGFSEYKLSGLEEYSLYADNVNFLSGKDVITFNAGGKLMALRPDVTLSVIKNVKPDGGTRKLFYDEKVYRSNACGGFSELSQIGVEVIGEVDLAAEAELMRLMSDTLAAAGERYVLDVSHIGVVSSVLDEVGLDGEGRSFALGCLRRKSAHDFLRFAGEKEISAELAEKFVKLMTLPSEPDKAVSELKRLVPENALGYVDELETVVSLSGAECVNVNFSSEGDADYYNGLIFKGYVEGVPYAVLSGGRYDKLLKKFNKQAQAIGFALYLGELAKYYDDAPPSPDAAVVYGGKSVKNALCVADKLRRDGLKVLLTRALPEDFNGAVYYAEDDI